ncbi:MAG: esterase-like activity of phytase family protein, partial [Rhizobiaceae bacterium]|nr:esterase-like activity of phytase family protein [Rhizobiaceae bacterium]
MKKLRSMTLPLLSAALATFVFAAPVAAFADNSVTVGGVTLVNKGRVAIGRIPANQRDKFGETFGSGSGMSVDTKSWTRNADGSYSGSLWLLPDRGYNAVGTTDYRPRLNTIDIKMMPVAPGATPPAGKEQSGVDAKLADTMMLTDNKGADTTGLDPADGVRQPADGFPLLPQAPNGKISLDNEAIVRLSDGTMFISDEYGPYIYRYSATGQMMSATQPPAALLPMRKGVVNFAS